MGRLQIPRTLAAGSLVGATTAFRVGAGWMELCAARAPSLVALALAGSVGGDGAATRQAAFRDGVIALARDSAERSWREMRRGVDDLDALTRPEPVSADPSRSPRRPYRVKP